MESHGQTFRAANPVALHGFHHFRPAIQLVQIVQQLFSVGGDFDKPLRNFFLFHRRVTTPAATVLHLFVGQYGLVIRAPVHGRSFFIHQAFVIQLGEKPLFPAVIFRGTGRQFTIPIVRKTQHLQLTFHVFDVLVSPFGGCGIIFDRGIFSWQTERIPTDRLQHVFAIQALVTGDHVTDGVVTHMTHVQTA